MRMHQPMGLSKNAAKVLKDFNDKCGYNACTETITREYEDGSVVSSTRSFNVPKCTEEVYSVYDVGFYDEIDLYRYTNPDTGEYIEEGVQEIRFSSGPMTFLALYRSDGTPILESFWSQEEMRSYD